MPSRKIIYGSEKGREICNSGNSNNHVNIDNPINIFLMISVGVQGYNPP